MILSATEYQNLYKLQNKVFSHLSEVLSGFYLTGGTALSRFYLQHRYSDDLDFFIDQTEDFRERVSKIFNRLKRVFKIDELLTLTTDTYTRLWIVEPLPLKIDFVNEIPARWGGFNSYKGINIDNPANILANKLGAIIDREEPKDVFDIVSIASSYSFNWVEVFSYTTKKQIVDETDIAIKLDSFPVELFEGIRWIDKPFDKQLFKNELKTVVDDFILGRDNSLGLDKPQITRATVTGGKTLT
jgi:hypothetical protein